MIPIVAPPIASQANSCSHSTKQEIHGSLKTQQL